MTILLTGIDGYVGWPTALKLAKDFPDEKIVGVDNLGRRKWVEECKSVSAVPIVPMTERLEAAKDRGFTNISFIEGDLADKSFVDKLIADNKPRVIIHAAAQPSAPYAHMNGEKANYTQHNNMQSTRNLLWALKEQDLVESTFFIETTTTGIYGAPEFDIPEGFLEVERNGKKDTIPYPSMGGSWYHMSKCHDVGNLFLANKQWDLTICDLRTAIVYGVQTEETKLDPKLATRFDFDFFFGVVYNRFIAMAIAGYPITVYGKGEQKKPMISLEDCCQSIVNVVKAGVDKGKFVVYNQLEKPISIKELAEAIKSAAAKNGFDVEVKHIPNPRVEKEEHEMVMENAGLRKILPNFRHSIETALVEDLKLLLKYKDVIVDHKSCFMK